MDRFYFFNFLTAFISDIVLHDLSNLNYIPSLKNYFNGKLITEAGIYAGLTIIIVLSFVSLLTKSLFNFYYPKNGNQLGKMIIISFIIGSIADYLIYKFKVFGDTLDDFYREFGVGPLGGLSLVFTIIVSYFLCKY